MIGLTVKHRRSSKDYIIAIDNMKALIHQKMELRMIRKSIEVPQKNETKRG